MDIAQSQQTNVEDYLSQSVEAAEGKDIGRRKGRGVERGESFQKWKSNDS